MHREHGAQESCDCRYDPEGDGGSIMTGVDGIRICGADGMWGECMMCSPYDPAGDGSGNGDGDGGYYDHEGNSDSSTDGVGLSACEGSSDGNGSSTTDGNSCYTSYDDHDDKGDSDSDGDAVGLGPCEGSSDGNGDRDGVFARRRCGGLPCL